MLNGKVAVVTGASRGIGKAIAIAMAKEGATVVINYNGSKARAEEVQKEIEENGGKAVVYQCDVADFAACEAFMKAYILAEDYARMDSLLELYPHLGMHLLSCKSKSLILARLMLRHDIDPKEIKPLHRLLPIKMLMACFVLMQMVISMCT